MSNLATLDWAQVDVFADVPYEGNMLAIFTDATGLTDTAMQSLARETNLSETTFIFPRDEATEQAEGVRVRIFTVREELPFAGHPTLGTASWLRLHRPELNNADRVVLQLNVGPLEVRFPEPLHENGGLLAEMLQPQPRFQSVLEESQELAEVLGLSLPEMHPVLVPQVVSTGLPVLIAPLASTDALAKLRPEYTKLQALLTGVHAKFVYCIAPAEGCWQARLPLYGGEDPATGSAAGCAVSYVVQHGIQAPDSWLRLLQGQFVHRPSRILAKASRGTHGVQDVRVRGCTFCVAQDAFCVPDTGAFHTQCRG